MPLTPSRARLRARLNLESLEPREVLAGFQPTAEEQLFLEILNDARANPAAYGASIGLNLSGVAPAQPLAFNTQLVEAARRHSVDLNARNYFAHNTPEGLNPGARLTQAGFSWIGYGESLAGGSAFPGPAEALAALIIDEGVPNLGHRRHLLALDALFTPHTLVGVGIVKGGTGDLTNYYTIDSGFGPGNVTFLTGVVYRDGNANGKYDPGEGLPGVTVSAGAAGAVTTFDSGGYSLPLSAGSYTVTAGGGGLGAPVTNVVTVGSTNVRLNILPGSGVAPGANDEHIRKLYLAALGRAASDAEVNAWRPVIGGTDGPATAASLIERSAEARTRLVKEWYGTYLGRPASGGEEQGWVAVLVNGAAEEDVLARILGSQEYLNRAGGSDAALVQTLFQTFLHRKAGDAEVGVFLTHVAPGAGRGGVARIVLSSDEFRGDMVRAFYAGLLHRDVKPAPAEVNAWVSSGLDLCAIRVGFKGSREFAVNG
jgi:uncharacterized protein YkwD